MRVCNVYNCNEKHHAKGCCKKHYKMYFMKEKAKEKVCCVKGCNNRVSVEFIGKQLCSKHGTRLLRYGNVDIRTRNRDIVSIVKAMKEQNDIFNYHIPDRNAWTYICKIYYGENCTICGWNKGNCDVHHKVPASKGGLNTINNGEVICPNCHRLKHKRKMRQRYSKETLEELRILLKA